MLSYGKSSASGTFKVKYVAGVLTVDKPFLRNLKRLSGGGRKSWIAYQLRDLDAKYVENIPAASQT